MEKLLALGTWKSEAGATEERVRYPEEFTWPEALAFLLAVSTRLKAPVAVTE